MASRQRNVLRYNSTSEPDEKGGDNNGFVQVAVRKPFDSASYTSDRLLNLIGIPKVLLLFGASTSHRFWICCSVGIFICILLYEAIVCDFIYIFHRLCAFVLPLFTLLCVYYWLAVIYRRTWSVTSIYLLFCACYIGEVFIQCFTWDLYLPIKSTDLVDDNHSQPPRHYNCYYYYHPHHHQPNPHPHSYYYHPQQSQQSQHQASCQQQQQQHQKIITTTSDTEEEASAVHLNGQGCGGVGQQAAEFQFWGTTLLVSTFNQFPLLVTLSIAAYFSSLTSLRHHALVFLLVLFSRFLACTQLVDWPAALRPFIAYNCGVGGILVAKYMEATLNSAAASPTTESPNSSLLLTHQDGKNNSSIRRRRPSNATTIHGFTHKARRTSLPALSMHKNHLQSNQSGMSAIDMTLLSEAHGLVTDMLADPTLPLHVVSALRALSNLLCPPNHAFTSTHVQRPRISGISNLQTTDLNNGSDSEEIRIMGEKLSALPKKFRRNLPPSLLRRMSTSTWTTTTSATGMPTVEPEPCRKRSASFRNAPDLITSSSPTSQLLSVGNHSERIGVPKSRSYSTTSLVQTSAPKGRLVRERQTVCSLHPLTASDINRLHCLSDAALAAAAADSDGGGTGGGLSSGGEDDDDLRSCSVGNLSDSGGGGLAGIGGGGIGCILGGSSGETSPSAPCLSPSTHSQPIPTIRRVINPSPDYESSDSPSNSENSLNSGAAPSSDGAPYKLIESRESEISFIIGQSPEVSPSQEKVARDLIEIGDGRIVYVDDGTRYDLDRLADDHLLDRINEWDYPIFDVNSINPDCVLSQMCYRVFLEVGLLDTFRIPIQEFLAYFHALECGYRDKPYHNRMHAADVLHAVYYLTSQPIPDFIQLPLYLESPPPMYKSETGTNSPGFMQRQSFNAEDTYGIMGANLPALELMALYTAAAMHDYDHPGRTNAFLVTTYAPEAVLYNDRSVLENHHAAAAWSLFLSKSDYNFLCHLDKAEFKRFRFLVIEAILATDLKRHFEILAEFNAKANDVDAPGIDWNSESDRLLAMEMCIKLADINGPCKKHDIHVQWTSRIADEFYEQGDEEASLGLPISPFMDRCNPQLAKLQESFINHLVAPLCTSYGQAGLLPGQWCLGSESEDEGNNEDKCKEESVNKDTRQGRKITCLQTQHLAENHDYWLNIIKEEEHQKDDHDKSPDVTSIASPSQTEISVDSVDSPSDEMETIHEEGVQGEKGPN